LIDYKKIAVCGLKVTGMEWGRVPKEKEGFGRLWGKGKGVSSGLGLMTPSRGCLLVGRREGYIFLGRGNGKSGEILRGKGKADSLLPVKPIEEDAVYLETIKRGGGRVRGGEGRGTIPDSTILLRREHVGELMV